MLESFCCSCSSTWCWRCSCDSWSAWRADVVHVFADGLAVFIDAFDPATKGVEDAALLSGFAECFKDIRETLGAALTDG